MGLEREAGLIHHNWNLESNVRSAEKERREGPSLAWDPGGRRGRFQGRMGAQTWGGTSGG